MTSFISINDKKFLQNNNIQCKVENGVGIITYGERSFQVSLLSYNQTELSSYLNQKQVKKIAQKVAIILLQSEILQESSRQGDHSLHIEVTKDKMTNLKGAGVIPIDEKEYQQIEAYLFQILNRDKPKEKVDNNALMIMPLYQLVKVSASPRLSIPASPTFSFPLSFSDTKKFKRPASFPFGEEWKIRIILERMEEASRMLEQGTSLKSNALMVTHPINNRIPFEEHQQESFVKVEDVTDKPEEVAILSKATTNQAKKKKVASKALVPFSRNPPSFLSKYFTSFSKSGAISKVAGMSATMMTLAIAYTFFKAKFHMTAFAFQTGALALPPPY